MQFSPDEAVDLAAVLLYALIVAIAIYRLFIARLRSAGAHGGGVHEATTNDTFGSGDPTHIRCGLPHKNTLLLGDLIFAKRWYISPSHTGASRSHWRFGGSHTGFALYELQAEFVISGHISTGNFLC